MKTLPKQKNFKKDIANTARYKRIVNILKSETSLPFMEFVVYTTSEFRDFMLTFQTDAPMIHILHSKMMSLFKSTLHKLIDDKHIPSRISELLEMDLEDKKKYKAKCDIGTKASSSISKVDALKAKQFYETAEQFLHIYK